MQQNDLEIEAVQDLIMAEVNVKEIQLLDDASGVLVKNIKPNFKTLGPRFGADMKEIGGVIALMDQKEIADFESTGSKVLTLAAKEITLTLEDVEITTKDIEGWVVAHESGTTVALDIHISEDLRNEGIARELINRIQNMRKSSGLEVTDRITIHFQKPTDGSVTLELAVRENEAYIMNETLADQIQFVSQLEGGTEIAFEEINTEMQIFKKN
jgi:isoleucyl-tRNA synthetase